MATGFGQSAFEAQSQQLQAVERGPRLQQLNERFNDIGKRFTLQVDEITNQLDRIAGPEARVSPITGSAPPTGVLPGSSIQSLEATAAQIAGLLMQMQNQINRLAQL